MFRIIGCAFVALQPREGHERKARKPRFWRLRTCSVGPTALLLSAGTPKPTLSLYLFITRITHSTPRRDQVREQPIRSRHTGGQMPKKADAGINEPAFAMIHRDQRTVQWIFTGVVPFDQRSVSGREFLGEIQAAFLHPTIKILYRDLVRMVQQRM